MNVFDFDGVCTIGLLPQPGDIIITGRGYDECQFVYSELRRMLPYTWDQIPVYFNPKTKALGRTRECSGWHKINTIREFMNQGVKIDVVFEDDPIQFKVMMTEIESWVPVFKENAPWICFVDSHWTQK